MAESIVIGSDPTGRLGHPKFKCEHCGQIFTRHKSTVKHDPPRFCGMACTYASFKVNGQPRSKPQVEVVCETCGKHEFTSPARAKTQRFCSQACMLVWRALVAREQRYQPEAHSKIICKWCGKEFETHTCRIKDGRGQFCSMACNGAWTIRHKQNRVSKAETAFGSQLKALGFNFESQHQIGKWVVDFCFVAEKIAVEYDGEYWHSLPKSIARDARKDKSLIKAGYSVVRVPERLHIESPADAIALVANAVKERKPYGNKTHRLPF